MNGSRLPWRVDFLSALAAISWTGLLAILIWWPQAPHWPIRLTAAALIGGAAWRFWTRCPQMLLSPLILLPCVAVFFYSIFPALYLTPEVLENFRLQEAIARYFSDRAELLVLQFSVSLVALALALPLRSAPGYGMELAGRVDVAGFAAIAALLGLVVFLVVRLMITPIAEWTQIGIGRQILHGIPPLISLCISALAWMAAVDRRWGYAAAASGMLGCTALFSLYGAKTPVFIAASCLLSYTVAQTGRIKRLWWSAVAVFGGLIVATLALAELRSASISNLIRAEGPRPPSLTSVVSYKLLLRQMETVGCFANVIDRRLLASREQVPVYFLGALVPRLLWPDKPNLSQGDRLATDYCDMPSLSVYDAQSAHSASVTLLGEPVIAAGVQGLVVGQAAILLMLGSFTMLLLRFGPVGVILLTALLPWLIDFDQSLGLYIANAVKMLIYMAPGIFLLAKISPSAFSTRTA